MNPRAAIFLAMGVALAGAWAVRWHASAGLRTEIAALHGQAAERAGLEAERTRLRHASPAPEELSALRAERAAVQRLGGEIEALRQQAGARARAAKVHTPAPAREWSIEEDFVAHGAWKHAGQRTPTDATQTALWAAAGGDLKALAAAIVLEPAAREKAHALMDKLPREVAAQLATAEDFVALLTAGDVPLTEAHVFDPKGDAPPRWAVRVVEFRDAQGKTRVAPLRLYQASEAEWRLVVPEAALEKYAARLAGGGPGAAAAASGGGR